MRVNLEAKQNVMHDTTVALLSLCTYFSYLFESHEKVPPMCHFSEVKTFEKEFSVSSDHNIDFTMTFINDNDGMQVLCKNDRYFTLCLLLPCFELTLVELFW